MKYSKLHPKFSKARNKWEVDVSARFTGKRTRHFYDTQAAALAGCSEIVLKLEMGISPQPDSKVTRIDALVAAFLKDREHKVVASTLTSLVWGTNLLRERFGHLPADQLTADMVDAWIMSLRSPKGKDFTVRSKHNAFTTCRTFYNWNMVRRLVPVSPFINAPDKQEKGHRLAILTVDEARLLLAQDFPCWFRAFLVGGMFAGLRTCEMKRMSHHHVDWDYNEIAITKEICKKGMAMRPRQISLTEAFKRHMHRGDGAFLEGKTNHDFDPYWKRCAALLGLPEYPSNICRHTFASMLLSASQNSVTTAFQMGHTSPVLLYSTYANLVTRRDSTAFWQL